MKKFKTRAGYVAYRATAEETALLGGRGICDDCGEFAESGFLVPVLDRYMCPDCFVIGSAGAHIIQKISRLRQARRPILSAGSRWKEMKPSDHLHLQVRQDVPEEYQRRDDGL